MSIFAKRRFLPCGIMPRQTAKWYNGEEMDTILVFRMRRYDSWHVKVEALNAAAERRGWRIQVIDQPTTETAIRKLLAFWRPKGIVIAETPDRRRPFPRELFGRTPAVFLDCEPAFATAGFPNVLHDTRATCEDAVRELLDIGCTDVAYVGWFERTYWCEDKRTACRNLLELHGKPYRELIPSIRDATDASKLNQRLCHWLRSLPKPCGILAVNDTIAEQVLDAASACQFDIPADLAVLGVDDDRTIGERTKPTLSSFTLDYVALSEKALDLIAAPVRLKVDNRILVRSFKLIRRQSSRRFQRKDSEAEAAVELIRREACDGLVPADVFKTFSCSRRLAQMRFKALTGHSVQDEILDVRFSRLFELMPTQRKNLGNLADFCGFPSALVMRRQFKSRTGTTMSRYGRQTM